MDAAVDEDGDFGKKVCMGTLSGSDCTKSYDAAGRPLKKSYSDGTPEVTYVYVGSRLQQVNNSVAQIAYGFDPLDRVTTRQQVMVGGPTYTHSATYRPAGLATETYPGGRVVSYEVDAVGRVTSVTGTKDAQVKTYASGATYAAHGGMASALFGNGQMETRTWNRRLQPVRIARTGGFDLQYYYCESGGDSCATNNGNILRQSIVHANVKHEPGRSGGHRGA